MVKKRNLILSSSAIKLAIYNDVCYRLKFLAKKWSWCIILCGSGADRVKKQRRTEYDSGYNNGYAVGR